MKKSMPSTAFIAMLLVMAALMSFLIEVGQANPTLPDATITFYSPQDNVKYTSNLLVLNFSISAINDYNNGTRQAWYSLDVGEETPVPLDIEATGDLAGIPSSWVWGVTDLPTLSDGTHDIVVSLEYNFGDFVLTRSRSVTFHVEAAKAIPEPSVPQFTVRVGDEKAIEVTIDNQEFFPYYDASSGWNISLFYNVRIKDHSEQNWTALYRTEDVPVESSTDQTVLSYPLTDDNSSEYVLGDVMRKFPNGSRVDFQVEAMIGYIHRVQQGNFAPYYFVGQESDWSNTRTLAIGEDLPSNPLSEPSILQGAVVIGGIAVAGVVAIAAVVYLKKRRPPALRALGIEMKT